MKKYLYAIVFWFFLFMNAYANAAIEIYIKEIKERNKKLPEPNIPILRLPKFHFFTPKSLFNPFEQTSLRNEIEISSRRSINGQGGLKRKTVGSLKFLGLIVGESKKWALITLDNDLLFYVKRGDCLKNNRGRVIEIFDKYIEVEEKFFTAEKPMRRIKKIYLMRESRG